MNFPFHCLNACAELLIGMIHTARYILIQILLLHAVEDVIKAVGKLNLCRFTERISRPKIWGYIWKGKFKITVGRDCSLFEL